MNPLKQMKMKRKNTKPEKNVKTQNGMKKFPNYFSNWIAGDAPLPYRVPLKPWSM